MAALLALSATVTPFAALLPIPHAQADSLPAACRHPAYSQKATQALLATLNPLFRKGYPNPEQGTDERRKAVEVLKGTVIAQGALKGDLPIELKSLYFKDGPGQTPLLSFSQTGPDGVSETIEYRFKLKNAGQANESLALAGVTRCLSAPGLKRPAPKGKALYGKVDDGCMELRSADEESAEEGHRHFVDQQIKACLAGAKMQACKSIEKLQQCQKRLTPVSDGKGRSKSRSGSAAGE
jgi:hypothetical protein